MHQLLVTLPTSYVQSHLPSAGFLPSIRKAAESLSGGSDEAKEALGRIITAAVACVDEVSVDRKVDVQRSNASPWPSPGVHERKSTQQHLGEMPREVAASPEIMRAPSGLLGDPFQMRQWYLHSFFGNFTVGADKVWQKIEAATSKPSRQGITER